MIGGAHYILSCDPGLSGQFCLLDVNTLDAKFYPLPSKLASYVYKNKDGERERKQYRIIDSEALARLVNQLVHPSILFVVLEHQQCFSGQGAVSGARIVGIYSLLQGMFLMRPASLEIIRPVNWKRALGLIRNGSMPSRYKKKSDAWLLATKLFPHLLPELKPKTRSFDKSDSLLLAEYARRHLCKKYLPSYQP